ncbi:MAG: hypothetical protein IJB19_02040 [Clostridia bacterium]|nr:hypothetical protein [Clostridia bacterium]
MIDNETPYVYDASTYHDRALTTVLQNCIEYPEEFSYETLVEYAGNKIVRHYVNGESEYYYTVYSYRNNYLLYIFLEKNEDRYTCKEDQLYTILYNDSWLTDKVFAQDLPSVILGDNKPDWAYADYYSLQEINAKIEQRWRWYTNHCKKVSLSALAEDVFDTAEKPLEYVYRTVQYKMFDTITDNRFASGGIYNYDLCLYKDGTAELVYRHYDEGSPYVLLREMRIALDSEEQARIEATLSEWDLNSIPTWNPEEPLGVDGETTYILGTNGYDTHLASMWCAGDRYGIYHIRTALEETVRAHEPESIYDAFLAGEAPVTHNGTDRYAAEFYPDGKNQKGNGYAYLDVTGDATPELHLRTPTSYTVIASDADGLYVYYTGSDNPYDTNEMVWLLYK